VPSFKLISSCVTILQGVEFSIFLFDFSMPWALQQCSATALPVIEYKRDREMLVRHRSGLLKI